MIDRKGLWIAGLIILAMTIAAFWRLSLPPNLAHVLVRSAAHPHAPRHTLRGLLGLFGTPLALLFVTAVLYARKWLVSGPNEAIQPWRHWSARLLVPVAVIAGLQQAFIIARSLGIGATLDAGALVRTKIVLFGGLILVLGNALPKMPWLTMRISFLRLNPWQSTQHQRFMGKIIVALGLALIISGALLPFELIAPAIWGLWLAGMAAGVWYRMKLRHTIT